MGTICAVGGGKGGVGKSLVAVNTACALALDGYEVILVDADLAGSNRPAEKLFDTLVAHVGPGRSRNTVLQDLLKGRRSEVGLINGLVVAESGRRGYAAPANARIAEIVQRIEAGVLKPGPDNLALAVKGS